MSKNGVSFVPTSWDKVWELEKTKLTRLQRNDILKSRTFCQKDNFLFVKYIFESGEYVILPMEFVEKE